MKRPPKLTRKRAQELGIQKAKRKFRTARPPSVHFNAADARAQALATAPLEPMDDAT